MPEKKLYRSANTLGGGVCTGIAHYFNIDPIIVQILTVVFTIATGGLLLIAYIALWIVVPREPTSTTPLEVPVQEVHSETYGQVQVEPVALKKEEEKREEGETASYGTPYVGSAHVPPVPPQGFAEQPVQPGETIPFSVDSTTEAANPSERDNQTVPMKGDGAYGASYQPIPPNVMQEKGKTYPTGALWVGCFFLFIGVSALLSTFVAGVSWWQLWPLLFVIAGITQIIVPGKKGYRMDRFVSGLIAFGFGTFALFFTLDIVSVQSLRDIFMNLWPLLIIMCGFSIVGVAMKAPLFSLLAGLSFIAFCVIGLLWFSLPGAMDMIILTFPNGQVFSFNVFNLVGTGLR